MQLGKYRMIVSVCILLITAQIPTTGSLSRVENMYKDRDTNKLVLAFYYVWYRDDGIRKFWSLRTAHHPALGSYNSSDENILRQHIEWARDCGIDVFVVSWWGVDGLSDRNAEKLFDIANRENFTLSIYYESTKTLTGNDEEAADEIIEDITYIMNKYAEMPCFLKKEGKPVIFFYTLWTHSAEFWENVTDEIRNKFDVFLVGDGDPREYPCFDGYHIYNPKDISPEELRNSYEGFREHYPDKLLVATVIPGFDNRKIKGKEGDFLPRYGGRTYNDYWSAAIKGGADWVVITSWNEWWEGTEIEPSRKYGDEYLELTRGWVKTFKESGVRFYIRRPSGECIYFHDKEISCPFLEVPVVVGEVTVGLGGVGLSSVSEVEFILNGERVYADTDYPFEWKFNPKHPGICKLECIVHVQNESAKVDTTMIVI